MELGDRLDTNVLERVLDTRVQVRQERGDRPLVLDVTRHTLRDFDSGGLREVPRGSSILVNSAAGGLGVLAGART